MKTRALACLILSYVLLFAFGGCQAQDGGASDSASASAAASASASESTSAAASSSAVSGSASASAAASAEAVTTREVGVVKDKEFGNVYVDLSIDEFNALGFAFGDSVDIAFDNGKTFSDVPYYSGYYVPVGELLVCGYPGYKHVVIAYNYGTPTWSEFGMNENSKVTVTLNEKGKYLNIEELLALEYSDEREEFGSDAEFASFREIQGGSLKEKMFYRSASPCNNEYNRASYANALAKEHGVRFVLNLADNEEDYASFVEADDFDSAYYDELYRKGDVLLLGLNANYRSDGFAKIVADAFVEMTGHDGPVLLHCTEGKDRTGFVCALLLALAGASYDQIADDYMTTYANYYGVTKQGEPEKYEAILHNVDYFLYCMCEAEKGTEISTLDLKAGAASYLRRGGFSDDQITQVEKYIAS